MNLPRIIVTDEDGNHIPIDALPTVVRDMIYSKAAERVKKNEALQEPSAEDLVTLMERLAAYAHDPRPREDRGPSPLTEEIVTVIRTLVRLRTVHREIILRISRNGEAIPAQDEKLNFAAWIRDEAVINSAIEILTGVID